MVEGQSFMVGLDLLREDATCMLQSQCGARGRGFSNNGSVNWCVTDERGCFGIFIWIEFICLAFCLPLNTVWTPPGLKK